MFALGVDTTSTTQAQQVMMQFDTNRQGSLSLEQFRELVNGLDVASAGADVRLRRGAHERRM